MTAPVTVLTGGLPESIHRFLSGSRVATVCFRDNDNLHAVNCFYAHDQQNKLLIMKSAPGTAHDRFVFNQSAVAGTILPDVISVSGLRGVQFRGETVAPGSFDTEAAAKLYTQKFQFAKFLPGYYWAVRLEFIKFTDNRVIFGHKQTWKRAV